MLAVKRVYAEAQADDGFRVLTDRLWPRGLSKEKAGVDVWLKEVAPTTALRTWFGHDPEKWEEFRKRYLEELRSNPAAEELRRIVGKHAKTTLLFGARDEEHNQAVVLAEMLGASRKKR